MKEIRPVKTGRVGVYLGKAMGTIYFNKMEIKGNPKAWVDNAIKRHPKDHLGRMLASLAKEEKLLHPSSSGSKMGRSMFWRNALGYYNNLVK